MLDKKTRLEILTELYNSIHSQIIANEINGTIWQRSLILNALMPANERAAIDKQARQAEKNIKDLQKTLIIIDEYIKKELKINEKPKQN